jgi:hypothetical protein
MARDSDDGSGLIRFPTSVNTGGGSPALNDAADDPLLYYSEPPSPVAEEPEPVTWPKRAASAWRRLVHGPPRQQQYRSGYLTLM